MNLLIVFNADSLEKPTSIPCCIFSNPLFAVMYVDNSMYSNFDLIGSKIALHDLPLIDKSFALIVPVSKKVIARPIKPGCILNVSYGFNASLTVVLFSTLFTARKIGCNLSKKLSATALI